MGGPDDSWSIVDGDETVEERPAPRRPLLPARDPTEIGPYEVIELIGVGGMGRVFRVRHRGLGVVRALKLMARPEDLTRTARFQREAGHLARIRHPNVVAVHDFGALEDGRLYFAMELIEGQSLSALLDSRRLDFREGLELMVGVAEGVAALHAAGVIHRDLKPQNVVIDSDGRPVVLDLGLAVAPERDERLTRTGVTLGTIRYMAPEQFRGALKATQRTDVYALGLILFEVLTGEPVVPRECASPHQVAAFALAGERKAPSALDVDLPVSLDAVFARTQSVDPEGRFPDAEALRDALQAVLANPGPARRQRRRQRALLGGLTLLVCGALAVALAAREDVPARPVDLLSPATPSTSPEPAPPAPSPEARRAGERELEEALLHEEPAQRAAHLEAWLERNAGHPKEEEARALLAGAFLKAPFRTLAHPHCVGSALFADGQRAVSAGDGRVRLWDVARGAELRSWKVEWRISSVAVADDGSRFVLGGRNSTLLLVDLPGGATRELPRRGKREPKRIRFSPDGEWIACGGMDSHVEVMDCTGRPVDALGPHGSRITDLTFARGRELLVTACGGDLTNPGASRDNSVRVWRLRGDQGREAREPLLRITVAAMPQGVAVTADGRRLLVACDGRRIVIYDLESGEEQGELEGSRSDDPWARRSAHGATARCLALDGAGFLTSLAGEDLPPRDELKVWDLTSGEELLRIWNPTGHKTRNLHVSADGRWVSMDDAGHLHVWDLRGLKRKP